MCIQSPKSNLGLFLLTNIINSRIILLSKFKKEKQMKKILIMLFAMIVSFKANAIDKLVDELEATEMNIMSLQDKLMNNEESNSEDDDKDEDSEDDRDDEDDSDDD